MFSIYLSMLIMLGYMSEDSQTTVCGYLLNLTGENAIANRIQCLSNKTNKQTNIYILRCSFKTQLRN